MKYPTLEEVNTASHRELARWYRFLPSPGLNAINDGLPRKDWEKVVEQECAIMNTIIERFSAMGGFNPALSKKIGWKA